MMYSHDFDDAALVTVGTVGKPGHYKATITTFVSARGIIQKFLSIPRMKILSIAPM